MLTVRLLVYFAAQEKREADPVATIRCLALGVAESSDVKVGKLDDLSLIQGEPCLALEASGTEEALSELKKRLRDARLRLEDADREVKELDNQATEPEEGE